MHQKTKSFLTIFLFFLSMIGYVVLTTPSPAQARMMLTEESCSVQNRDCIISIMILQAANIEKTAWRDQTYREIAKTLAFDDKFEQAISLIDKVKTPDTKAMTIRGIGMMLAGHDYNVEELNAKFAALHKKANEIDHDASHGIALTYIAMSQAFAGDYQGAWKTCEMMENEALRNKAYGETAEIQAEYGHYIDAQKSIKSIKSSSFRNKAYVTVSRILSDKGLYDDAYSAAKAITNPYKKTQSMQYILDKQKPRERLQDNVFSE